MQTCTSKYATAEYAFELQLHTLLVGTQRELFSNHLKSELRLILL